MNPNPFPAYLNAVQKELKAGNATEQTYRPALKALIEALDRGVTATNEPRRVECGAPDFLVSRQTPHGPVTVGYIETKDVDTDLQGIEADSERPNPATREGHQLSRYRAGLENLILTNYLQFRWYVTGQLRLVASLETAQLRGRGDTHSEAVVEVDRLLRGFLEHRSKVVATPRILAERMARLTRLVADLIVGSFVRGTPSDTLRDLYKAFSQVLIPDLTIEQFADMFAQTLAYGLFAARVNHQGPPGSFDRRSAAYEIPRTNPFLRKLFATVSGAELDEEAFAGFVDDLASLLDGANMTSILADFGRRTRQEDPVVHFYETFLSAYDPELRERRGVYYTPEPVVSYIVRSVDYLLKTSLGRADGLADRELITYTHVIPDERPQIQQVPRVLVLDPACGTGTFLYAIVDLVREAFMQSGDAGKWPAYVRDNLLPRLFGFELMMAPYAVAHLKLGMQLAGHDLPESLRTEWSYDLGSGERIGVYLTNTLEDALKKSELLLGAYISEEANAATDVKRGLPIMVVLGNPPYSGHSANASVREEAIAAGTPYLRKVGGRWERTIAKRNLVAKVPTFIGRLLGDYYQVDEEPLRERNPKWLQDDYVKFIRFGQWRVGQTGAGILAFITNHGYLDNPTFRGMRHQLMKTFTDIYVLDLHGNSRKGEQAPDHQPDENVFDIQQGVAIGVFVKNPNDPLPARVHHAHLWGTRERKYDWLKSHTVENTEWTDLPAKTPFYFFIPQHTALLEEYERGWKLTEAMPVYSMGLNTHRDAFVIDFDQATLLDRIRQFRSASPDELERMRYGMTTERARRAQSIIQADADWQDRIVRCLYRPFDIRFLYWSDALIDRPRRQVNKHMFRPNISLVTTRQTREPFAILATNLICGQHKIASVYDGSLFLPLYTYASQHPVLSLYPEGERSVNFSQRFIESLESRLELSYVLDPTGDLKTTFGPENVLHYMYAVLYSPSYRKRYAEYLTRDVPRIPLTADLELFRALAALGSQLLPLHLMESPALSRSITHYPVPGDNFVGSDAPVYVPQSTGAEEPDAMPRTGRVYISRDDPKTGKRGQYFEGVASEVWEFGVGGYRVCERWLKDRRGRVLTYQDITHYERIIVAVSETIRLMKEIDEAIEEHGGWPIR